MAVAPALMMRSSSGVAGGGLGIQIRGPTSTRTRWPRRVNRRTIGMIRCTLPPPWNIAKRKDTARSRIMSAHGLKGQHRADALPATRTAFVIQPMSSGAAEPINKLDVVIGTRGRISRLRTSFDLEVVECAADRFSPTADSFFPHTRPADAKCLRFASR